MRPNPDACLRTLIAKGYGRETLVREWLMLVNAAIGADFADYQAFGFDASQQALLVSEAIFVGSPAYAALGAHTAGEHPLDAGYTPATLVPFNRPMVRGASHIDPDVFERQWQSFGIMADISVVVSDETEFCGIINFCQTQASPTRFQERGFLSTIRGWLNASKSLIRSVHHERNANLPPTRVVYLYDDKVRRMKASIDQAQWSADEARYDLQHVARAVIDGAEQSRTFVDGVCISAARLRRPSGSLVWIEVEPLLAVQVTPFCELGYAQRQVGAAAAGGATIADIAAATGRSHETVRSHLKSIYDKLRIGSRAELAEAYGEAMNWTPSAAR